MLTMHGVYQTTMLISCIFNEIFYYDLTSEFLMSNHAFTISLVRLSNFFIVITFGITLPDPIIYI